MYVHKLMGISSGFYNLLPVIRTDVADVIRNYRKVV